jgi:hypothetical protein
MYRTLTIFAAVLIILSAEALGSTSQPYTPADYVKYSSLIVDGILISDEVARIENRFVSKDGWITATNWACVLVDSVLHQSKGRSYATGDTICFRYPTSDNSYHPDKPGLVQMSHGSSGPLSFIIGRNGLYSFNILDDGECRKGSWFFLDDSLVSGIYDVLNKLAADSIGHGE